MRKVFPVLAALAVLGGCGEAKKAFDDSFDKSFGESCTAAATKSGVPVAVAAKTCQCAVTKINERFSATEKATVSNEKLKPILAECVKSVVQNNG